MDIVSTVGDVRRRVKAWRKDGLSVGLVPTMGYLHEGHASLIARAKAECNRVVVSIFVNPTQFAAGEDLDAYPRDPERDAALCERLGADCIFMPTVAIMYPSGSCTFIDVHGLADHLCGRSRPGHFRGVCTVVAKLFNIAAPDRAYFGEKDAQQLRIIARMARDLDMDLEVVPCPTVRETDGLAKSSRNAYLKPDEREAALVLYRALATGREMLEGGERNAAAVIRRMEEVVNTEPLAAIDYIEIVDAEKLTPVERIERPVLAAGAVRIGKTRLIDNFVFAP